jgi:hypothetical protein
LEQGDTFRSVQEYLHKEFATGKPDFGSLGVVDGYIEMECAKAA